MRKRNLHIMIIAALFGVMAWASVSLRDQYVVTVYSPFVLEDIPEGWAVRTSLPQYIQLRFRGDGWRLAAMLLGGVPRLTFSASVLPSGNKPITFNDVAERVLLTPGIQLVDIKPDSIRVELERSAHKRVPVILDCVASFREGYGQVGPTIVTPDSVTIAGAESVLRGIDSWRTDHRLFENLRTPVDAAVPLASAGSRVIEFSVTSVRVSIGVEPFAEKVFVGIPVDVSGVPGNREVILIPPRIELVARAGIKQLSSLSLTDFRVSTPYTRITADSTGAVDTDVSAPQGVQVVSKRPDRVQYIVRRRL
jgi:hypothetical protein